MKPEKGCDENLVKATSGRIFIVKKRSSTSGDLNDGRTMREEKAAPSTVGGEPGEDSYEEGERADGEDIGAMMMEEETDGYPVGFDSDDEEETGGIFGRKLKSIFIRKSGHETESPVRPKVLPLHNPVDGIVKKAEKGSAKLRRKRAISFVDTLMTLFLVAPLVIGQWRGIWNMMDIYSEFFPEWLCFILGTGLHVLFAMMRSGFHGRFVEKWRTHSAVGRVAYDLVRLAYTYIFCVACNAQWRGGWMIFSRYLGSDVWIVSSFTVLFMAGLVILRAFRNLLAPPFIVVIDRPERVFQFPTRYNVSLNNVFSNDPDGEDEDFIPFFSFDRTLTLNFCGETKSSTFCDEYEYSLLAYILPILGACSIVAVMITHVRGKLAGNPTP